MNTEKKIKFIIIDDHPFIRDGILHYIKSQEGFEFIGDFSDTRSVLNSGFAGKPDVIILDLNLPGMDGEKSFERLKRKFPECRIVAFTQYAGREKELTRLGFDGYIVKSEKDSLIEALLAVVDGKKYFKKNDSNALHASPLDSLDTFLRTKELTSREIEAAKYIMQDFTNREIGEKMFITEGTVETHRKHIKQKLQAKSKRDLYAILKNHVLHE